MYPQRIWNSEIGPVQFGGLGEDGNPVYFAFNKQFIVDEAGRLGPRGEVYEIVPVYNDAQLGGLRKAFKKVGGVFKKAVSKINEARKALTKAVLKTSIGRTVARVAGAVAAPFTGGASLAVAEAAARYGKARYQLGLKRSTAFKKAAVGAAVGFAAGKAIQLGYQSIAARGGLASVFGKTGATTVATGATTAKTGGLILKGGALLGTVAKAAIPLVTQVLQGRAGAGTVQSDAESPFFMPEAFIDPNQIPPQYFSAGGGVPGGLMPFPEEGEMPSEGVGGVPWTWVAGGGAALLLLIAATRKKR